jgi:M6 family metalloprotease-like protein
MVCRLTCSVVKPLIILVLLAIPQIAYALPNSSTHETVTDIGDGFIKLSEDLYVNPRYLNDLYRTLPVTGTQDILVIFVYFADVGPSVDASTLLNEFLDVDSYYVEVSYGQVSMVWWSWWDDPWWQLPNTMAYYGAASSEDKDIRRYELIWDTLATVDPYVDFRQWDHILIVHAGGDEAISDNPNDIWSFAVYSYEYSSNEGNVILDVAVISEYDPIGVIAHELGHSVFKWPDLYDYSGQQEFIGRWGLMAAGSWNGPLLSGGSSPAHPVSWCKIKAGWIGSNTTEVIDPLETTLIELSALETLGGLKVIKIPLDSQHYYLIEARAQIGFDSYLPGEGVLILYVDETLDSGEGIVRVVDSTPGDGDVDNGQWNVGDSFYDEANDVYIDIRSRNNNNYTVQVQYLTGPAGQPTLWVWPDNAPAGVYIDVIGSGFTPDSNVYVYFDTELITQDWADLDGDFYSVIRIPIDAEPGDHIIRAVDEYGVEKSVTFTVNKVKIQVSSAVVNVSETISVSVSGLGPNILYWIKFDDILLFMLNSDYNGTITFNFSVPAATTGTHRLKIIYPGYTSSLWRSNDLTEVDGINLYVQNGAVLQSELSFEIMKIQDSITTLENMLITSTEELKTQLLKINGTLNNNINILNQKINSLNSDIQEQSKKLTNLNISLTHISTEINNTLTKLQKLNTTLNNNIKQLNELSNNINTKIQELNNSLEQYKQSGEQKISALEKKLTDLETQLSQARMLNIALVSTSILLALIALILAKRK